MLERYNKMVRDIAKIVKNCKYLLITAGAGMSVDSGLPDFRGKEGFWREYPIAKKLNLSFEELANPYWFKEDPFLAWAFYGHRFNLYKKAIPHKGYFWLLEIAKSKKDYFVLTSNVDGHFHKAGFEPNKIYEIHGSINYLDLEYNKSKSASDNNLTNYVDVPKEIKLVKLKDMNTTAFKVVALADKDVAGDDYYIACKDGNANQSPICHTYKFPKSGTVNLGDENKSAPID